MIRTILQLSKWNRKKKYIYIYIYTSIQSNENIQNIRLQTIRLLSQIYIKNIKNISNSHCTLYICNFLSLENVEISMQVSNRQLFHHNENDVFSRNYFWLGKSKNELVLRCNTYYIHWCRWARRQRICIIPKYKLIFASHCTLKDLCQGYFL